MKHIKKPAIRIKIPKKLFMLMALLLFMTPITCSGTEQQSAVSSQIDSLFEQLTVALQADQNQPNAEMSPLANSLFEQISALSEADQNQANSEVPSQMDSLVEHVAALSQADKTQTGGDIEQKPPVSQPNQPQADGEIKQESLPTDQNQMAEVGIAIPSRSDDETIQSIYFKKDVGIRDALAFLAAKYQKNIVPSPKVDGKLAFTSLYKITFEEAMEAILGTEFRYEQKGNLIKVYTTEEYGKIRNDADRMTYKAFTLYYITAAEVKKLITPVLSGSSKLEVTAAAKTGVPIGDSLSGDSGGGDATAMYDTIVVYDYPENLKKAESIIASVDIRPKQVLIEATILSATLTEDTQFGIDWSTMAGVVTRVPSALAAVDGVKDMTKGAPDYFKSAGTGQVSKTGGLTIGVTHDNIGAIIKAIEETTDVTIMANPKILAINKQLGQVYIGKKIGYQSQTTQTTEGTTQAVEFLETGTKLSFRPYIGNDGYIRMDIHPKDSSGTLKTNSIPDETSAELMTNIMVKDGETVVIGGLFRNTITAGRSQIPVLGDIPILGALFRGTADQNKREEVIILLSPHIIKELSSLDGEQREEDVLRKKSGAIDSMQWMDRSRIVNEYYSAAVKAYQNGDIKTALDYTNMALNVCPTNLETIRLREKIIHQMYPGNTKKVKREMLEGFDSQYTGQWLRK
jgi:type IV pilus assembly protein PilQ